MADHGCSRRSAQSNKGLCNPFLLTPAPITLVDPSSTLLPNSLLASDGHSSQEVGRPTGLGKEPFRLWLPVSPLPGVQGRWLPKAHYQPQASKPVSQLKEIPPDKPFPTARLPPKGGLLSKNRPVPSLLPRPNKTFSSEIPLGGIPGLPLLHDMPSIWVSLSSTDLLKPDKLGCQPPSKARYKSNRLSRRLSPGKSEPRLPSFSGSDDSKNSPKPGLDGQFGEIRPNSSSQLPIPWHCLEPDVRLQISSPGKTIRYLSLSSGHSSVPALVLEDFQSNFRVPEFCSLRGTVRKTPLSSNSMGQPSSPPPPTSQTVGNPKSGLVSNSMVVGCSTSNISHFSTISSGVLNDRRFKQRMGCSGEQPDIQRSLGGTPEGVAHKPKGDVCGSEGPRAEPVTPPEQGGPCPIRQQDSCILHPQGGRNQVLKTASGSGAPVQCCRLLQHRSDRPIHSGEVQCLGRQPVSSKTPARLESVSERNAPDLRSMGSSRDRPFCDGHLRGSSSVRCSVDPGSPGAFCRCLLASVEILPCLDFPAPPSPPSCPSSSELGGGPVYSSRPLLGEGVLVARPGSSCSSPSHESRRPGREPDRSGHGSSSPRREIPEFAGLVGSGWLSQVPDWDQPDLELLRSAWRDSTLRTYKAPWKRWLDWTARVRVSINDPSPQDLAKFLSWLHSQKFSYSSILVHKSVVANFANPARTTDLITHPVVRQILKAISLKKIPENKEIWDVSVLTSWISSHPPSEDSHFEVSRHVAILLLLCSGRRVHDLTLLLTTKDRFQDLVDSIVFWPAFGSKTDSAVHRQSGWKLNQNPYNSLFDPVFWVRKLISLSANRIRSKNVDSLFITTRGVVKAASRSVIAGWIRTAMTAAGINASAGSFRSAVGSSRMTSNSSLDSILKKGNWKSERNFLKHYFKPIAKKQTIPSVTMDHCFDPI
uniref:Core-binding (CB) domain-containing protein n=1 Tax=Cacopsylla melanoneura TaxID=428564 RepID=A0A8D8Q6E1_9HEMI